jgi:hypothetical protein
MAAASPAGAELIGAPKIVTIESVPIKRPRGRPRTGRDPSLSLRLPNRVIRELEQLAEARGVPRSQIARELIIIALLGGQMG